MRPELADDEVHVWMADCDAIDYGPMWNLLDGDEVNRANRFREPGDSRRYAISHGVLRSILSEYLDLAPWSIEYERGPYGKPRIAGSSWLRFNMSHSNGMAAYALTSGRDVGIDLEYMRDIPFMELSLSVLSANEDAYLRSVPAAERMSVFFRLWTRKEAYVKAIGEGLHARLNNVDVSLCCSGWSVADVGLMDGYAGAIAVPGEVSDIKVFKWPNLL